jgi:hypothetical protein
VSAIVLKYGGTEDEAIAALLHDAVEDQGADLAYLEAQYGRSVASIVAEVSEDKALPKMERKLAYANAMSAATPSVQLVSAADKLDNLRDYSLAPDLCTADVQQFYAWLLAAYTHAPRAIWDELMVLYEKIWPSVLPEDGLEDLTPQPPKSAAFHWATEAELEEDPFCLGHPTNRVLLDGCMVDALLEGAWFLIEAETSGALSAKLLNPELDRFKHLDIAARETGAVLLALELADGFGPVDEYGKPVPGEAWKVEDD